MIDVIWVRIESWHAVEPNAEGDQLVTLCGRLIAEPAETRDELPADKSCELCLRIVAREADAKPAEA